MRLSKAAERGTALIWAIVVLAAVMGAVALVAGGLTRQLRHVNDFRRAERTADLVHAGRLLARWRLADDAAWRGPEELSTSSGTVRVRLLIEPEPEAGWIELEIRPAGTGRSFLRRLPLPGPPGREARLQHTGRELRAQGPGQAGSVSSCGSIPGRLHSVEKGRDS